MSTFRKQTSWLIATVTLLSATFCVSLTANAESSDHHEYYKQYKPYRTYFRIAEYMPAKNNFWISYEADEDVTFVNDFSMTMRADSVEEAAAANPIYLIRDIDPAPTQGRDIPPELQPIVDALKIRLQAISTYGVVPGTFRAGYFGKHYNVAVSEDAADRRFDEIGARGEIHFKTRTFDARVSEDLRLLQWVDAPRSGWRPMNCPAPSCSEEPLLVNYVMPTFLEGTLPLTAHIVRGETTNPAYGRHYFGLERKILATVGELSLGTYVNPIHGLLAAQGESYLPQESGQEMQFDFTTALIADGTTRDAWTFNFPFKTDDVTAGPLSKTVYISRNDIKITVTFDTALAALKIQHLYLPTGESDELVLPMTSSFVTDGYRQYVRPFVGISGGSGGEVRYFSTHLANGAYVMTQFRNVLSPRMTHH